MANYVDQINLNGNVADIMGANGDGYYPGENLTVKFAAEIAGYSDVWAWIKARITAGNFSKLHVGDYIPVTCSNNKQFNARIAGINTYKNYGSSAVGDHIDFISDKSWPTNVTMNLAKFNNGLSSEQPYPWLVSNCYYYLNSLAGNVPNAADNLPETTAVDYTEDGVYYYLPEALKTVIVPKTLYLPKRFSNSGIQQDDTAADWAADIGKLWLPSEVEVMGMSIHGSKYAAMGCTQYPLFANNMNRVVERRSWWTSTPVVGNSTMFAFIAVGGQDNFQNANNSTIRVLVCFRVA